MNRTATGKRALILRCLTEGNSIRATARLTGSSKNTIFKLVVEFGEFAAWFQDEKLRNLQCTDLQLDEIWAFCGCKEKNKGTCANPQGGDIWTWTALCRDTKLVPSWLVGDRRMNSAREIVNDLESRLANHAQISTNGHRAYIHAIKGAFGEEVDCGRLIKVYGTDAKGFDMVIRADKEPTIGSPDEARVCTSHVERQNLTMRKNMRRFTRLTNAFSKKAENHAAMVSIHFLNYNFVRRHQTIKTAPAVAAGVIPHPMALGDLIELFDEYRARFYPAERPLRYKARSNRTTYEPQAPLIPWYLDPESGGRSPALEDRKPGISYED